MKINYIAPINNHSGYSEFSKSVIAALVLAGADVKVHPLSFEAHQTVQDTKFSKIANAAIGKHQHPDINIINTIPTLFGGLMAPKSVNIGFTMWEADRLPEAWVSACNRMDAILVPSKWNRTVFANSGVTVPILIAHPAIDPDEFTIKERAPNDVFTFYSIFQWTERKNPKGLIRAFWTAFTGNDKVKLVIKTYVRDKSSAELGQIQKDMAELKQSVRLKHYPKVDIITEMMTRQQMLDFHQAGDVFVLPTRAEGWGMPIMEAMATGKPVITTNFSAVKELIHSGYNAIGLEYTLEPIQNMSWFVPFYDSTMFWANPDLAQLGEELKLFIDKPHLRPDLGKRARENIFDRFNTNTIGAAMLETLNRLVKK